MQVIHTMAKPRRTTKQSKQAGGTFLGIVLGLIVGLAVAVVVALYITRAPTPFVSKVAPPATAPADTTQAPPFDPNRPLQGKTPGQPVTPQAAQPSPPNTAPGATSNQTQAAGLLDEPQIVEVPPSSGNGIAVAPKPAPEKDTTAATPPAKKPSTATTASTPVNGNAPAPATKPGAASSAADATTGYFLQVGAYKTAADAEQQRARLAFQGFESKVTLREAGGVTYYRVRIGPFAKFDDMNAARQRLSSAGVDTAVIRFTKQ
ncbi:SPOR domain-containing protein [Paraburkholderia bonniea]|uniref:SPOR domain-containing protein n=1 Tax=Paraburkholderia bonniea TaxID=2152891 RepID=UPI00158013CC|nr:SPOR domain-containing protein [Paraburkholderia bonniea]WJF90086.1 SPOR domain-containing protein [Paraburkholderia bonniea]WJF93400.1 SPOR domain-containing protein [Paraburkholderia bonniea]